MNGNTQDWKKAIFTRRDKVSWYCFSSKFKFSKICSRIFGFLEWSEKGFEKFIASTRKCHLQRESKIALLVVTEVVGERGWHVDLPHQRLASQGRVPVNGLIHFNCHQIENWFCSYLGPASNKRTWLSGSSVSLPNKEVVKTMMMVMMMVVAAAESSNTPKKNVDVFHPCWRAHIQHFQHRSPPVSKDHWKIAR